MTRMLFIPVDGTPEERNIDTKNDSLTGMYAVLGCQTVEHYGVTDSSGLYFDEEGRFKQSLNKTFQRLYDPRAEFYGPMFFANHNDEGSFVDITDEQIASLKTAFADAVQQQNETLEEMSSDPNITVMRF